ncbi:DUF1622 domain-containing protein [Gelidibacter japonicus]|uniref:DUF1622 domain-containing protein n=1 Tax=Gelidibacter japonicus TaxID=1962232 RepID=UPI0013D3CA5E|nr:DUF1622 domain-containing protein [Gelidibacter japonicus]
MEDFVADIKSILDHWGELTEVLLNAISLITIVTGFILSLVKAGRIRSGLKSGLPLHTNFRYFFGGWLVVALEVQLAADIVGTIISPTTAHLIELGAIAVIRTFLNYFLSKELAEVKETEIEFEERQS